MTSKIQKIIFEHPEAEASPTFSLDETKTRYSVDTRNCYNGRKRDCDAWTGKYEPVIELAHEKKSALIIRGNPSSASTDVGVKITNLLSMTCSPDLAPTYKDDFEQFTATLCSRSRRGGYEDDLHDKFWPLLDNSFPSNSRSFSGEYYPPTHLEYYLQEVDAGVNQLARWSIGMKDLTSVNPVEFRITLRNFRDQTGENPLRVWAVKLNTVISLIRDIQFDIEAGISNLD
ncbi:hypothetical protein GcC1_176022 [Golovinomyces cichoracearum]|uniref:Uncharacterized protein n=1 Tax=Golovinomyces cichoracearum TaxID=62708 RepID=A0A420HPD0_9PEZI|nr:hypothetical protein GcC1_176022 [Golovinomyces cichoracearum]